MRDEAHGQPTDETPAIPQERDREMTILNAIRQWWTVRGTQAELARLGDRELNDAGIARWNIEAVARGAQPSTAQVV
ncbi:MAG: DUF1127 domain-containing protein [Pseudomonadota bacterium]